MGRKVKISELKKWDVYRSRPMDNFTWVRLGGNNYMLSAGFIVKVLEPDEFELEVELLGRMEFVCDGKEEFSYEQDFPLDLPN